MELGGEQRIAAPRERVWEGLNDPAILAQCIPGCESLGRDGDDRFAAVAQIKIGPIGARFKGAVTLTDLDPPNGYQIVGEGQGGMAGSAKGRARVTLVPEGAGTLLRYKVDAEVGGRLAQLGGPIIDATAKRLAGAFFRRFEEVLVGAPAADPAPIAAAPAVAPVAAPAPAAPMGAPPTPAPARGTPVAWLLAIVVAALVGFLVGRGLGGTGSDGMGLAIGLLLLVVGGAGVEYGRRIGTPVVTLDDALLARLRGDVRG